jgi:hypothetical protein
MQFEMINEPSLTRCHRVDNIWKEPLHCSSIIELDKLTNTARVCTQYFYRAHRPQPAYGTCCEEPDLLQALEMCFNHLMQENKHGT